MKQVTVAVQLRSGTGKGAARKLRRAGQIPGVFYGPKTKPVVLAVQRKEFRKILSTASRQQVFVLDLGDQAGNGQKLAMIKELQLHPVNDDIRHVDFYEVFLDQEVEADVPISLVGKAKGVEVDNGVLQVIRRTLRVSCLPMGMPKELNIDVSDLGLGEAIHVADVRPPEGVRLLDDGKLTLVTIVGAGVTEEAAAEEEEKEVHEE